MKNFFALTMCLAFLTATAAEFVASNATLDLKYDNNTLRVYPKGKPTLLATFKIPLKGKVTPTLVKRPDEKIDILSLRGDKCSIAFKFEGQEPAVTMSLNRFASPVVMEWNAEALVLPDQYSENVIIEPGQSDRTLPPFIPLYLGLIKGGNAMISILPIRTQRGPVISGDLKRITFDQQFSEDFLFVFTATENIWGKTTLPPEVATYKTSEWKKKWQANWTLSFPVEKDFIAPGDAMYFNWSVISFGKRKDGTPVVYDRITRGTMTNIPNRNWWNGGFEGTYHYPVEFDGTGALKMFNPRFGHMSRFAFSTTANAYIYCYKHFDNITPKNVCLPWKFIPRWDINKKEYRTTNFGSSPTTCSSTASFEKIFYKEEDGAQEAEIKRILDSMQFFVESIRGRAETSRVWAKDMERFCEQQVILFPELATDAQKLKNYMSEFERLYNEALPKIKQPEDLQLITKEVCDLAGSAIDAEKKEEISKKLGRDIRTVGGGQDNLIAKFHHVGKVIRYRSLENFMAATSREQREFWQEVYRRAEFQQDAWYGHDGK